MHAVAEEFGRAGREMKEDSARVRLWRPILEQYRPTMVGECEEATAWSREVARDLLRSGMFAGPPTQLPSWTGSSTA